VTQVLERLPLHRWPAPAFDAFIAHLADLRPWIEAARAGSPAIELERVSLRAPVANPGKVVAVRGNYRGGASGETAAASSDPELFLKATSSVAGPGDGIELRWQGRRVDHEVELVAVIGRRVDGPAEALQHGVVAGYCVGIDVTMRGSEDRGLRKSLDGFTVLGPWLTTADEVADPGGLAIELAINGEVRQRGDTSQLLNGVPALLAAAASYFTLQPGDILMTGTPPGVGPLERGDVVRCSIDRLGTMRAEVR
jgi:2-keto-4-pentenoate hydratase/2-oxohepta-3-ene-1,7-dioic acid hydratase in catechol pathway